MIQQFLQATGLYHNLQNNGKKLQLPCEEITCFFGHYKKFVTFQKLQKFYTQLNHGARTPHVKRLLKKYARFISRFVSKKRGNPWCARQQYEQHRLVIMQSN
jgi:hypothetical protein